MPFPLSKNGNNVSAEVQRWQYFLIRRAITQVGRLDGHFGDLTEKATKIFQLEQQLPVTGKVNSQTLEVAASFGYTILPDNYYAERNSPNWPPRPDDLSSPSSSWRNTKFTCFKFIQKANAYRDRPERIVIRGSCDGTIDNWSHSKIVELMSADFAHVEGYRGYFRIHHAAKEALEELLRRWKSADLLHLVVTYAGAFDPRYIYGHSPGNAAQPERRSTEAEKLSNHAFGSAFDINATWNWIGDMPELCGKKGSVRELVQIANGVGFFWGGHFGGGRIDGMHFELAR